MEQEHARKQKKFEIPLSDEPGNYDLETLKKHFLDYLAGDRMTNPRIRKILLPALVKNNVLTRDEFLLKCSGFIRPNIVK